MPNENSNRESALYEFAQRAATNPGKKVITENILTGAPAPRPTSATPQSKEDK